MLANVRVYIYGKDSTGEGEKRGGREEGGKKGGRDGGREAGSGREHAGGFSHWPRTGTGV